ncbi:MAG TPA: hypothetical protein VGM12_19690 [Trebonia sp.]|jgi:uncharacterized RmlC-like cupin family protein
MAEQEQVRTPNGDLQVPAEVERVDAYAEWQKAQGVPVISGFAVQDLKTLELGAWDRRGVDGAIVSLQGTGGFNDSHVLELAGGGASNPEKHLYEEVVFILSGHGSTEIWYDEARKHTVQWKAGSLFAIPLNASYLHTNGDRGQPARLMSMTSAPTVIRLFHNESFIFDSDFRFTDRFDDTVERYFSGDGILYKQRNTHVWDSNFIPDVRAIDLYPWSQRGAKATNIMLETAENTMGSHISRFPVGSYKKAHWHGPGAHVLIIGGTGYSNLWEDGDSEPQRVDWQDGSLLVPPEKWFHQHFNTGNTPAGYLALRFDSRKHRSLTNPREGGKYHPDVSIKLGGAQIEFEDEDKRVHEEFEKDLARNGVECQMRSVVPWCTGTVG